RAQGQGQKTSQRLRGRIILVHNADCDTQSVFLCQLYSIRVGNCWEGIGTLNFIDRKIAAVSFLT
ncbi:MAG: hypothetical protein ACI4MY_05925, partial [Christensenellales bacterium]